MGEGPLLEIDNTTSRVDLARDPGGRTDAWSTSGVGHQWALAPGDIIPEPRASAGLSGLERVEVTD
ncbi:hypothetical protein [Streptomyces sp. NPDC006645]|uniref:hypothetical protein n=1 Tax=unclassified Streptomyces TaxID=2593676 RepID=UPI0033AF9D5D